MDILTRTISAALKRHSYYLVPKDEIERVWPEEKDRHLAIVRFAIKNQWRVFSYSNQGAMFMRNGDWS